VTATAAELNILDGVTATAAELNILDGVTATADELNILDGVTGFIDDDTMATASDTTIASSESIKAYVDNSSNVAASSELELLNPYSTSGDSGNVAHGLGGQPQFVQLFLVCLTDEHGYTAGQYLPVAPHNSYKPRVQLTVDATNIRAYTNNGEFYIVNAATNLHSYITPAKWKLVARFIYVG
jgi:hypothetical protein